MKRFISQIILLVLFISFPVPEVHAFEIDIHGTIGGTPVTSTSTDQQTNEADESKVFASPKQKEITLKKLPNTGSLFSKLTYVGVILLLCGFMISRWISYRKQED